MGVSRGGADFSIVLRIWVHIFIIQSTNEYK